MAKFIIKDKVYDTAKMNFCVREFGELEEA